MEMDEKASIIGNKYLLGGISYLKIKKTKEPMVFFFFLILIFYTNKKRRFEIELLLIVNKHISLFPTKGGGQGRVST